MWSKASQDFDLSGSRHGCRQVHTHACTLQCPRQQPVRLFHHETFMMSVEASVHAGECIEDARVVSCVNHVTIVVALCVNDTGSRTACAHSNADSMSNWFRLLLRKHPLA